MKKLYELYVGKWQSWLGFCCIISVISISACIIVFVISRCFLLQNNRTPVRLTENELFNKSNTDSSLYIKKFSATSTLVTIEYSASPKRISEWGIGRNATIINAAYFEKDFSPSGLLVVGAKRIGTGMFDQDKTGLLVIQNNVVSIRNLTQTPIAVGEQFDFALQSFPLLIVDSHGVIQKDSDKKARRTAIGIDAEHNIYIFAVTNHEVSLFEFMNDILETHMPAIAVLNLDGGPSTGVWEHGGGVNKLHDSQTEVSSIIRLKRL